MNDHVLFDALDRLVPECQDEQTDWRDVLRRGGVSRRRPALLVIALVVVAVVLLATPALGVRGFFFGRGTAPPDLNYGQGKLVPSTRKQSPEQLLRRVLAGLGPESAVKSARLGHPPPRLRAHLAMDALWLYVSARTAASRAHAILAQWEATLAAGALWDELYLHATRPLAGCTILASHPFSCFSAPVTPHAQRFANPDPGAYLDLLRHVGQHDNFSVVSIRYLHPLQRAPIIVLRAKDRTDFTLLWNEPVLRATLGLGASRDAPFEGWFLEVRDSHGLFFIASANLRGEDASNYSNSADVMHRH